MNLTFRREVNRIRLLIFNNKTMKMSEYFDLVDEETKKTKWGGKKLYNALYN